MKTRHLAFTATILSLALQPAHAHRFWIIPSSTVLSGEKPWVTIDAAISNTLFFPDHNAPDLQSIAVTNPSGASVEKQNASKGKFRSTFDLELSEPGTYRIAVNRSSLMASWMEDGERKRWRGTPQELAAANLKDKPGLQVSRNDARVETFVTSGEPTLAALKPTGKGLELVIAENHPNDLFAGEEVSFILHMDGKPAASCEVTCIKGDDRYRNETGEQTVTTNPQGKFTLSFPEAGRYWLNANVSGVPTETDGITIGSRMSYTATFEVLPE